MAKIGLIQVDNRMASGIRERQDALISLATACLNEGADLVFFPEAFQYVEHREVIRDPALLQQLTSEWKARCAALAQKYSAYIVPWDYLSEDGKIYNASYILDRKGNEIGVYHKCNLTRSEMERGITNGNDYPVFDLDFGRVGIMICFDNYFPESAAALANRGAQLVLYPLYGDTLKPQWDMKLRARAIDHSMYVASCQLDPYFDVAYTGMVDPTGNVTVKLDTVNSHRVVEIEMGKVVCTNTANLPGHRENLHEYLHKCRNYHAFSSLASEGTEPKSWEEICGLKVNCQ